MSKNPILPIEDLFQSDLGKLLRNLANSIAHEIKNPLMTIINTAELVKEEMDEETEEPLILHKNEIISKLEKITRSARRIDEIIKKLKDVGISTNEPINELVKIEEVIKILFDFEKKITSQNIQFYLNLEGIEELPFKPLIMCSRTDLIYILNQIMDNAIEALKERQQDEGGAKIQVKVLLSNRPPTNYIPPARIFLNELEITSRNSMEDFNIGELYIVIKIRDNGHGIPARVLDNLGQPFTTTKNTNKILEQSSSGQQRHLGLGLFNSCIILRKYGGYLSIRSEQHKFTEVALYFPTIWLKKSEEMDNIKLLKERMASEKMQENSDEDLLDDIEF